MASRRVFVLALLLSFAVYLIPIVGPHAMFVLGTTIAIQFRDWKNPAWALTNLGVGLLLQAMAFALLYWFLRRRSAARLLVLLAAAAGAAILVQYLFLLVIPSWFLIERETAPEVATWTEACSVADAHLASFRTSARPPQEGWTEAWVSDTQGRYSILRMPNCEKRPVPLPQPKVQPGGRVDFSTGIQQVIPGGQALVQRSEPASGKTTWLRLDPGGALSDLPGPVTTKYVAPFFSRDGSQTAWLLQTPTATPPVTYQVQLWPVAGGEPRVVDLAPFGPASYELLDVEGRSGELLLLMQSAGGQRLLAIDADGRERPAPVLPQGADPQGTTLLLPEQGVVAWDAYKDEGNYRIAWSLTTGSGTHRIPKGSSISAAAIDPSGRYLAISTSTTLNLGGVRDSVVVLRTASGEQVFRRYFSAYNRSGVIFLGREYFAYSDMGTTHVLMIR